MKNMKAVVPDAPSRREPESRNKLYELDPRFRGDDDKI
jgi:hypothetical protein